jgi:3'(2'), 5'-bisphosphate nucleotidase
MTLESLLPDVMKIAQAAGEAILAIYNDEKTIEIIQKQDKSPLTAADLASHHVIVDGLTALTPDVPVLSEESANIGFDERKTWTRYWLVDPLDGTKEFLKRNGEFTVNIALIENGVPIMGVVYVPVTQVLYGGAQNVGAFKIERGIRHALQVSDVHEKIKQKQALIVVGSRSHGAEGMDACIEKLRGVAGDVQLTSMGSSLKMCLVAEGKADFYPRLAPTSEWDTAAAHAVLSAAGGQIVDTDFAPLKYNQKDSLLNPFFYAVGDQQFGWKSALA